MLFLATIAAAMLLAVLLLPFCSCFSPILLPSKSVVGASKKKNLLLVIAHPDDESMFFGPTLLSLTSLRIYNVKLLCISSGNADGIGTVRKTELLRACSVFKIPVESVEILDVPELQDGFMEKWDIKLVGQIVKQKIASENINIVITFDAYGVSGHPNHRSVHHAIRALITQLNSNNELEVEAWQLESSYFIRKFLGPLDIILSVVESFLQDPSITHYFYSQYPWINAEAMKQHQSQWLWFRKLFIIFSKYTYVNTLKLIH